MRVPILIGLVSATMLFAGPGFASADDGIVIDFIRHAESGNMSIIDTSVPGPDITTPTGVDQAQALVNALSDKGIDEIWASTMVRSGETAAPLAHALGLTIEPLQAGLNEIDAGIFEGAPVNFAGLPLGGALYLLAPALWTLGLTSVPLLGSTDSNGIVFDARVDDAIETIYKSSDPGDLDAVFSHEGTIAIWTLMNVKNPDFGVVLNDLFTKGELLPYTGQVEIEGSPGDWTLLSWDGTPVPQDPGLLTNLFVDLRDFIEVPQRAGYDISEAFLHGNAVTIDNAIQLGFSQIETAAAQFPVAIYDDIVAALGGAA